MAEVERASSRIFISYRREDTEGHVLSLYERLSHHFGEDRVFKDTDGIAPGQDFAEVIKRELESCSVMLAVIGKEWVVIQDHKTKKRRLDNPNDYLRLEVATALSNEHVLVIPVLVGRGTMPAPEDLPDDLKPLSTRNAVELSGTRWKGDVDRLIHAIDRRFSHSVKKPVQDAPPVAHEPVEQGSGEFDHLEARRRRQIAEHVKEAKAAFEARDYEAVLEACNEVFWLHPQEPEARMLASNARAALDEQKIQLWLTRAREALAGEDFASASDLIDQALSLNATHADAGALRQDLLLRRKKKERERERDDQCRAALDRAQKSLDEYDFEEALHHADDALTLVPDSAVALELRAKAEAAREEERRERELKRKAQQAVKDAQAKFASGQHEVAIRTLQQFSPSHELVIRALQELSGQLEQIARERQRKEAEERARAEAEAALERQRQQAEHEALARRTVEQAQQLARANQGPSAIELLESFGPAHALVNRALAEVRQQVAEIERQRLLEQERQRQLELERRTKQELNRKRHEELEAKRQQKLEAKRQSENRASTGSGAGARTRARGRTGQGARGRAGS